MISLHGFSSYIVVTDVRSGYCRMPTLSKCEKVDKYSTDEFDCYLLKLKIDSRHSIYGYLTKPKKAGKYPVVLCPPGAGIKTIKEPMRNTYYAKNGFIRLEMEIHGLNPEMTEEQFREDRKSVV